MQVERIRLLVTLRAGGITYKKGRIFIAPDIPASLLQEVRENTGTVEVLGGTISPVPSKQEEKMIEPVALEENIVSDDEADVELFEATKDELTNTDWYEDSDKEELEEEEEEKEEEVIKRPKKVLKRSRKGQ